MFADAYGLPGQSWVRRSGAQTGREPPAWPRPSGDAAKALGRPGPAFLGSHCAPPSPEENSACMHMWK